MAAAGLKWARVDFRWTNIESTQGTYVWTTTDPIVTAANAGGIKLLAILESPPAWALTGGVLNSANYQDFINYAVATVLRYSSQGVKNWEIFNEANISANFLYFNYDATIYAHLLHDTYLAIKAADPTVTVLFTGLAPSGTDSTHLESSAFVAAVYATIGQGYFDAMNYHPYAWNAGQMNNIRAVMAANGDGAMAMWLSEYGDPTQGTAGQAQVTERFQAQEIALSVGLARGLTWNCGPLIFYEWKDGSPYSANADRDSYFGIVKSDATYKPAIPFMKKAIKEGYYY